MTKVMVSQYEQLPLLTACQAQARPSVSQLPSKIAVVPIIQMEKLSPEVEYLPQGHS